MEILEKMNPNKKHLLVIHPKFCIRAQKQVECLISYSEYQITIITNVKKYGKALTPKIKNNSNIISFSFHKNTLSRFLFRRFIRNLKNFKVNSHVPGNHDFYRAPCWRPKTSQID